MLGPRSPSSLPAACDHHTMDTDDGPIRGTATPADDLSAGAHVPTVLVHPLLQVHVVTPTYGLLLLQPSWSWSLPKPEPQTAIATADAGVPNLGESQRGSDLA